MVNLCWLSIYPALIPLHLMVHFLILTYNLYNIIQQIYTKQAYLKNFNRFWCCIFELCLIGCIIYIISYHRPLCWTFWVSTSGLYKFTNYLTQAKRSAKGKQYFCLKASGSINLVFCFVVVVVENFGWGMRMWLTKCTFKAH